jgi:hypothetical protein
LSSVFRAATMMRNGDKRAHENLKIKAIKIFVNDDEK